MFRLGGQAEPVADRPATLLGFGRQRILEQAAQALGYAFRRFGVAIGAQHHNVGIVEKKKIPGQPAAGRGECVPRKVHMVALADMLGEHGEAKIDRNAFAGSGRRHGHGTGEFDGHIWAFKEI